MAKNLINSFSETSLDLENSSPLGGPNRTNSNINPNYTVTRGNNGPLTAGGQPLKDKDGKIVKQELNRYTPTNTYLQQMGGVANINNTNARIEGSDQQPDPEEIVNSINNKLPF